MENPDSKNQNFLNKQKLYYHHLMRYRHRKIPQRLKPYNQELNGIRMRFKVTGIML